MLTILFNTLSRHLIATVCRKNAQKYVAYHKRWVLKNMQRILWSALLLPTLATSASFDCKVAATRVEHLICANSELSALDDRVSEIFKNLTEEGHKGASHFRSSQKTWLAARNACVDDACIQQQYERRIANLTCDHDNWTAASAVTTGECAYYTRLELDRSLSLLENRYEKKLTADAESPEHVIKIFTAERKAWKDNREAQCALYGATEGGSDAWKSAFAGLCEVDETKKRITRIKKALDAK